MKTLLILMLGMGLSLAALADENRKGPPPDGDRLARIQQHLGLSDEQVEQMRAIREQGGSRKDMHAVLTAEQRVMLEERRAQRRGKGGPHAGGGQHGQHGGQHDQPEGPTTEGSLAEDSDES